MVAHAMAKPRLQILICDGPSCGLCFGSEALLDHAQARIAASESMRGRVHAIPFTCFGRCDEGPNMMVRTLADGEDPEDEPDIDAMDGVLGLYLGNDQARLDRILDEHCETGEAIAEWAETY